MSRMPNAKDFEGLLLKFESSSMDDADDRRRVSVALAGFVRGQPARASVRRPVQMMALSGTERERLVIESHKRILQELLDTLHATRSVAETLPALQSMQAHLAHAMEHVARALDAIG